jgi:hypothetical protein
MKMEDKSRAEYQNEIDSMKTQMKFRGQKTRSITECYEFNEEHDEDGKQMPHYSGVSLIQ